VQTSVQSVDGCSTKSSVSCCESRHHASVSTSVREFLAAEGFLSVGLGGCEVEGSQRLTGCKEKLRDHSPDDQSVHGFPRWVGLPFELRVVSGSDRDIVSKIFEKPRSQHPQPLPINLAWSKRMPEVYILKRFWFPPPLSFNVGKKS